MLARYKGTSPFGRGPTTWSLGDLLPTPSTPPKFNSSPLKMVGWKMIRLPFWGPSFFLRGHVTLPPIIMEVENGPIVKERIVLEIHPFSSSMIVGGRVNIRWVTPPSPGAPEKLITKVFPPEVLTIEALPPWHRRWPREPPFSNSDGGVCVFSWGLNSLYWGWPSHL